LGGADIRRCLFASDVLLSSLQCKAVRRSARCVDRNTNETTGQDSTVLVTSSKEPSARPAKSQRDTETLRRANDNIGAEFTRGSDETARKEIGGDGHECASDMGRINCGSKIANFTR
jgi:hypothetical protein